MQHCVNCGEEIEGDDYHTCDHHETVMCMACECPDCTDEKDYRQL